ncbi:MAG: glycosyltransferase [Planctomycetota bacterium]
MTDSSPLVTVVVPTCNRPDLIRRCLDALAVQTYSAMEVIVVDDGSDDDTPDVLQAFGEAHPDLNYRWLRNETNLGANPSRNRGIDDANGSFIAFLDSDCIAEPDWLERLMAAFTSEDIAAVTGLVRDPEPTNIYELTFKGTHRMGSAGEAHRLVAGNMAIRRDLLMKYRLDHDRAETAKLKDGRVDTAVSGRGDEEGLSIMLRRDGHRMRTAPDAAVFHEHYYTRRSFFRQAVRGGRSAARLVYKYRLPPRLDMLPFIVTYIALLIALPLAFAIGWWLMIVPAAWALLALAAITYNDIARKGKTVLETAKSFPVLLAYYHVRLWGYVTEAIALRLGMRDVTRV